MPVITEAELRKAVEQNELRGLYFLYGEEPFLTLQWASRIVKKAAGKDFSDFNLQRFPGSAAADDLGDAAEALPFMAERKCVVVSDLGLEGRSPDELKKLEQLFSECPETTVLVVYQTTVVPDLKKDKKWKSLFALAKQHGTVAEFLRKKPQELEKILVAGALKRGCTLPKAAAAKVVEYAGADLQTLSHELEKLCAYTGTGEISFETVDRLVTKSLDARIYDLSKWILAGNYEKAYLLLDQLFSQNVEPVSILAILSGTYVDLYRVRAALESGESAAAVANHFDYSRREFVLSRAEREVRDLSTPMLRESLDCLLKADVALKSARGDRRTVLEKALVQLLLIAKGERQ